MEHHLRGKKVGFFGGTFDPIHLGHLNLAVCVLESFQLDEILFCPANFSPEKVSSLPTASKDERREMVEIAIAGIEGFSLLDFELKREGPSFTIDTIRELKRLYPDDQFFLILGEDVLAGLPKWKGIDKVLQMAPPIVGARPYDGISKLPSPLRETVEKGRFSMPIMEISSTEVRERLVQKKICDHLIPSKVLDYIKARGLY